MHMRAAAFAAIATCGFAFLSWAPSSAATSQRGDPNISVVRTLLRQPEDQIDLAKAEATIERMVDPSVDTEKTLKQLDEWASKVRSRFPQGDKTNNDEKIAVLNATLSQPGDWNDFRPFTYDFNDEFGLSVSNKLMSSYLASRKGNCVSMPVLFAILGQKLGLPVTLANAPNHLLVKYKRDNGEWMNIEATTAGTKSDARYEEELNITPRAIETGIYLRPLSHKESLLALTNTLMQFYEASHSPEEVLALTDVALDIDPNDIGTLLYRGNAYLHMIDQRYIKRYQTPSQIPQSMRSEFMGIYRKQMALDQQVRSLGWVPESVAHKADYQQTTQRAKSRQQGTGQ